MARHLAGTDNDPIFNRFIKSLTETETAKLRQCIVQEAAVAAMSNSRIDTKAMENCFNRLEP